MRLLHVAGDAAEPMSRLAVTAAAMGNDTHGLRQLLYLQRHLGGKIDPVARPAILPELFPGVGRVDSRGGAGHLATRLAVDHALEMAEQRGAGLVGCGNAHWIGALGPYLLPVLERGWLGIMQAQFSGGRDAAPLGGIDPMFATDPIALCIPAARPGDRVLADFSLTTYSHGRVNQMQRDGQRAPQAVFLDAEGQPSDDPQAFEDGGSMQFMGGELNAHKGYALALWAEAMAAAFGGWPNDPDRPGLQSVVVQVIRPDAGGADTFGTRWNGFLERVRGGRELPGGDGVRLPGERGLAALEASRRDGVTVDAAMLEQLNRAAEAAGVPRLTGSAI